MARAAGRSGPDVKAKRTGPRDATLAEAVRRIGSSLLTVVNAAPSLRRPVHSVVIFDAAQGVDAAENSVVLAVGVDPATPAAQSLVRSAGVARCGAVVFRCNGALPSDLVTLADQIPIALLTTAEETSWMHLASLLHISISAGPVDAIGGVAVGDLFAFANTLADETGGAITLEDEHSRVLAYSQVGAEVDEPRKQTILGRRVPDQYLRMLRRKGVWDRLTTTDDIVEVEAQPEIGLSRRVATSVRAAGDLLGFIWVAETNHALVTNTEAILREAARTAALHIVRDRVSRYDDARREQALLREVLEGGADTELSAARLGLRPLDRYAIAAIEAPGDPSQADRVLQATALYCSTFARGSLSARLGPRTYALIPGLESEDSVRSFAQSAGVHLRSALRSAVHVAFLPVDTDVAGVPTGRLALDRALNVLAQRTGRTRTTVVSTDEVRAEAGVLELVEVIRTRDHLRAGKLDALIDTAPGRRQPQLETLRAYLDHFGDVRAASASLNVHPNSFRYRLARALELSGIDLTDPAERLMVQLQLRLLDTVPRPAGG